jgi:hypothetical protein
MSHLDGCYPVPRNYRDSSIAIRVTKLCTWGGRTRPMSLVPLNIMLVDIYDTIRLAREKSAAYYK